MTAEEIAAAIQDGQTNLYADLWEQVCGFVAWQAKRYYVSTGGFGGVEVEDLIQSGYIAMLEALIYYDRAAGYKFNTILGNCLKKAFLSACGLRTSKRDPLLFSRSLNTPVGEDQEDGKVLEDVIEDPRDMLADVDQKLFLQELRPALDSALSKLPPEQRDTINRRYYQSQTYEEISKAAGIPPHTARSMERKGLDELRKPSAGLWRFVEESTPYYLHVGKKAFNSTETSSVEKIVLIREIIERRL